MGLFGTGKSKTENRPWPEADVIIAEGVLDQKAAKDKSQIIYLKNISIISKPKQFYSDSESYQNTRLIAYLNQNTDLKIGNHVRISGKVFYPSKADNPGGFDQESYYGARGISLILNQASVLEQSTNVCYFKEFLYQFQEKCKCLIESICSEEEAGVVEALLFGSRENLNEEIKSLYQDNGLIHVLSISGLHISTIGMVIYQILRKCGISFSLSSFSAMIVLVLYGVLTAFPISAVRAIMMFSLFLGSQITGRTYDMPIALTLTAAIMLCVNPALITQSGFLLSFSSVAGVYMAGYWKSKLLKGTAAGIGLMVWLVTLPITAYFFYQVPIYGLILNLVVVPSMSAIIGLGILGIAGGFISVTVGQFLYGGIHYILQSTFFLENICRRLPKSVWITGRPKVVQIILFYLILLYFVCFFRKINKIDLIKMAFGIILGIGVLFYRGNNEWSITFLNVGQGDGICIRSVEQTAWMIDGGSSSVKEPSDQILQPYLKYYGITQIDGWFVSHFDYDHISGLLEFLETYTKGVTGEPTEGIILKSIIIPDLPLRDELKDRITRLAEENEIPVIRCRKGDKICQNGMSIEILNPDTNGSYADGNAASMVMKVSYKDFSALLTGDVQDNGENELSEGDLQDVDVVKISHHGSKNSTSEAFLQKMNADQAVISCGKNNFYGHPHQEVLDRLDKYGYRIYRTDRDGAVTFTVP